MILFITLVKTVGRRKKKKKAGHGSFHLLAIGHQCLPVEGMGSVASVLIKQSNFKGCYSAKLQLYIMLLPSPSPLYNCVMLTFHLHVCYHTHWVHTEPWAKQSLIKNQIRALAPSSEYRKTHQLDCAVTHNCIISRYLLIHLYIFFNPQIQCAVSLLLLFQLIHEKQHQFNCLH